MCLKCLMDRYTPSNSLSKAEYLISAADSFLEKNAIGGPSTPWERTAPTASKEASVVKERTASGSGSGWISLTASQRASLEAVKASSEEEAQDKGDFCVGTEAARA